MQRLYKKGDEEVAWFVEVEKQLAWVIDRQHELVSGVDSKLHDIRHIQEDADHLAAITLHNLEHNTARAQMERQAQDATALAGGAGLGGLAAAFCLSAAPLSIAACSGIAATSAMLGLAGNLVATEISIQEKRYAVMRSEAVQADLKAVIVESANAMRDTAEIRQVLLNEARWMDSLRQQAVAARRVVELVVETINSNAYVGRDFVLSELAAAVDEMLYDLKQLAKLYNTHVVLVRA